MSFITQIFLEVVFLIFISCLKDKKFDRLSSEIIKKSLGPWKVYGDIWNLAIIHLYGIIVVVIVKLLPIQADFDGTNAEKNTSRFRWWRIVFLEFGFPDPSAKVKRQCRETYAGRLSPIVDNLLICRGRHMSNKHTVAYCRCRSTIIVMIFNNPPI